MQTFEHSEMEGIHLVYAAVDDSRDVIVRLYANGSQTVVSHHQLFGICAAARVNTAHSAFADMKYVSHKRQALLPSKISSGRSSCCKHLADRIAIILF
ncbi:hypothetical protein HNY73_006626 [Argiope bruennichi]|uniref:Uncharacterized protein n=1 Tax=Argiope bruennichi TaxID=94029 RepID=A0A8T0FEE2_ARGBR|nr:hypothetical protein HNY73_006626 [Argiope bruennichi]